MAIRLRIGLGILGSYITRLCRHVLPARPAVQPPHLKPNYVGGLTKSEAEDLLDWLEGQGYQDCEVFTHNGRSYVVRYQ